MRIKVHARYNTKKFLKIYEHYNIFKYLIYQQKVGSMQKIKNRVLKEC